MQRNLTGLLIVIILTATLILPQRLTQAWEQNSRCGSAPQTRLAVGTYGVVSPTPPGQNPLPVRIHVRPDAESEVVGALSDGTEFLVIGGPVCGNNMLWWQVKLLEGVTGWAVEGVEGSYFLDPAVISLLTSSNPTIDCPGARPTQLAIGMTGVTAPQRPQQPVPVKLHDTFSVKSLVTGTLVPGDQFSVVDGPQCSDGVLWWKLKTAKSAVGWTAEGDKSVYLIVPIVAIAMPTPTPSPSPTHILSGPKQLGTIPSVPGVVASNHNGRIAYLAFTSKKIMTVGLDGKNPRLLIDLSNLVKGKPWLSGLAASPDGKTLAFSNDVSIYTIKVDGSGLAQLTRPSALAKYLVSPAWSPDGQRIAMAGGQGYYLSNDRAVYVMNSDGSNMTKLADNADAPAWSPDGQYIAFFRWSRDDTSGIYVIRADGTDAAPRHIAIDYTDAYPAWSPDGKTLLYATDHGNNSCSIINASGGVGGANNRRVFHAFPSQNGDCSGLAWLPDNGGVIAGRQAFANEKFATTIYLLQPDGTRPQAVITVVDTIYIAWIAEN